MNARIHHTRPRGTTATPGTSGMHATNRRVAAIRVGINYLAGPYTFGNTKPGGGCHETIEAGLVVVRRARCVDCHDRADDNAERSLLGPAGLGLASSRLGLACLGLGLGLAPPRFLSAPLSRTRHLPADRLPAPGLPAATSAARLYPGRLRADPGLSPALLPAHRAQGGGPQILQL